MLLSHGNIVIREATLEDADILLSWWNDGAVMAHAGFPNGLGLTKTQVLKGIENRSSPLLILVVNDTPVGEMSYRAVGEKTAEIGIKICNSSFQNRGYGVTFLRLMMAHLFNELEYAKIVLDTNLKNKRAQHFYEKLGFVKTSVAIDSWQDQLGELQSSVNYELTKAAYHSNQKD